MNKKPLASRIPIPAFIFLPLAYCIVVPLVHLMFWWSKNVDGVEPKTGQCLFTHKTVGEDTYYRRDGLRYRFTKWKLAPKPQFNAASFDICSLYPNIH